MRRLLCARGLMLAVVCALATGCRHRPAAVAVITLPPADPVPLERAPDLAGVVAPSPVMMAPLPTVKVPVARVKKIKKKAAPVVVASLVPGPSVSAGAPVPAANAVGALTAGGEESSEMQKKAADLLAVLEKRVAALPKSVVEGQPEQVARVKYFWSQAHAALLAGDADGAWNLATKAKVLLDDVAQ